MLASHFNTVLVDIISEDQTGFMKGHHAFSNLCRLLNVIHSASPSDAAEVVISLDAEKPYHRVQWEYLFAVLKKFGFGKKLISVVHLVYTSPQACNCTNNLHSPYFPLS